MFKRLAMLNDKRDNRRNASCSQEPLSIWNASETQWNMNSCLLRPEMQTSAFLLITLSVLLTELVVATETEAGVLGQLSLAGVEEYNDNVTFSDKSKGDFVTTVVPTLRLIYKPFGSTDPNLTANLSVPIEIFARNSQLNNIGKNILFN